MRVSKTWTATASELFSLLTCLQTIAFAFPSIFLPLEMINTKIWETLTVLAREMYSSVCCPRLKNARA